MPPPIIDLPRPLKSEIVYVENLTSEDILDEHMTLKGMEDVEDTDYEDCGKTNVSDLNELHVQQERHCTWAK